VVLYVAAVQLTQSEVFATAAEVARATLSHEIKEFAITAPGSPLDAVERPHRNFFTVHEQDFEIDLFDSQGAPVGVESDAWLGDAEGVRAFLSSGIPESTHLATVGARFILKSLRRIEAQRECAGCHEFGQLLGVLSAKLDLTPQLERVRTRLRRNLALLVVGWAAAITLFAFLVERTVKRSAKELQAELAAAETGEPAPAGPYHESVLLDPVAADVHRTLRKFLQRRRERDTELAARLAHTDQLASLGQLAAGLAHEIKNPLAGVSCTLELLQEQLSDEAQKGRCTAMLAELRRVDQTLALLLSSARPAPVRIGDADPAGMLDEIQRFLAPALRRRRIRMDVEVAGETGHARIDAAKIRQVLVNLINNAADAIGEGGRISLRAARLAAAGGLVITVEDDGPGIGDEDKARIFTPFFTTKAAGTGLGLTISRALVEQHGGRLEVESVPGRGTIFVLVLPNPIAPGDPAVERAPANSELVTMEN
jgi:signal transduction histidine kinase